MATLAKVTIILVGALCFLSLVDVANSAVPEFIVKGRVFCDVCRVNFFNRFSEPMPGAQVELECRDKKSGKVTYRLTGAQTDDHGDYTLPAEGDHHGEHCEVTLVKSSRAECDEIPVDGSGKKPAAEVTLIANSSFRDKIRLANPLVFTRKEALHKCVQFFKDLQAALGRL
ncbi:Major pollen allergen Lig v 1 [Sesamum alatum]|uniref:Major pollen allergen Lig v 1 n=1 Tax=Sesamum alatum TaxID=300844 RepID=A0AAE1YM29_9LAMI|nr:Major pollen allergen Lig v 1 [Sesamum alatum]